MHLLGYENQPRRGCCVTGMGVAWFSGTLDKRNEKRQIGILNCDPPPEGHTSNRLALRLALRGLRAKPSAREVSSLLERLTNLYELARLLHPTCLASSAGNNQRPPSISAGDIRIAGRELISSREYQKDRFRVCWKRRGGKNNPAGYSSGSRSIDGASFFKSSASIASYRSTIHAPSF